MLRLMMILMCGLLIAMAPIQETDYETLPPEPEAIQKKLAAAKVSIAQATEAVEKATGGTVTSIDSIEQGESVNYSAVAFANGMELRASVDGTTGAVTVATMSLKKAIELALAGSKGSVKLAKLNPTATPPTATVEFYEGGKGQRVVVNAATGAIVSKNAIAQLPGDPVTGAWVTTSTGLKYSDLKVGDGAMPADTRSKVKVHYSGWLNDGTKFDSSVDRGQPISFPLGGVIAGWREGVSTMKVGGKRKLIIPWALGYGAQGSPGGIPPKATLIFDVELLEVTDTPAAPAARPQ